MCNEYARMIALGEPLSEAFSQLKLPPLGWSGGRIPNALEATPSVRIRDTAPVFRMMDERLEGAMTTWAWPGPRGKPVFNFVSERRDFARSDRVLILATGFYEYTEPMASGVKLKDRHLLSMVNHNWFWIAGIVQHDCFTMLTTAPGPDVAPYHDRQIVTLAPLDGLAWLTLSTPQAALLQPPPAGTIVGATLRRNGIVTSA